MLYSIVLLLACSVLRVGASERSISATSTVELNLPSTTKLHLLNADAPEKSIRILRPANMNENDEIKTLRTETSPEGSSEHSSSMHIEACDTEDLTWGGGNVMKGTINLYNIYLGTSVNDFQGTTTPTILRRFAEGLDQSAYANILTSYYDGSGYMSNRYAYKGDVYLTKSISSFTVSDVLLYIEEAQLQKGWTNDLNGGIFYIYSYKFLLTLNFN